jgi:pSer/pThr/pTyr-binding forkhead associated (FHA) protein
VLTAGKSEGKVIPVPAPEFVIGRDPQCHLRPASPIVSKRHCALLIRGGKAFVRDFNSTNGTFVNRSRIEPGQKRPLKVNDVIQIGTVQMRLKV